ncbi:MAG: DUF2177 family protein [Candidatus Moraniibacteriota bacterium]|nr:MAG: DUF2177 family protein [Candidatus Moranbacteria bacterium]
MKTFFITTLSSIIVLLTIDSIWLTLMAQKFYARHIGHLMAESPNFFVAIPFYILYVVALAFFVIIPSLEGNFSLSKTFFYGAFFGLAMYATYDLTNQATLKGWPTIVTLVDLLWGALLTGTVAVSSLIINKYFS